MLCMVAYLFSCSFFFSILNHIIVTFIVIPFLVCLNLFYLSTVAKCSNLFVKISVVFAVYFICECIQFQLIGFTFSYFTDIKHFHLCKLFSASVSWYMQVSVDLKSELFCHFDICCRLGNRSGRKNLIVFGSFVKFPSTIFIDVNKCLK